MELQMLAPAEYVRIENDPTPYYSVPFLGSLYRKRVTRCLSLLPAGRRVLEVGYGTGVSFLNLGRKFDQIHGIDLHDYAQDVSCSFASAGLNLHLRQGSVLSLPYESDSFDAALAISIHEHLLVEDQQAAFAEVRRVLRPGGCYVIGVPGLNPLMVAAFYALGWKIRRHHHSSEKQVLGTMRQTFRVDAACYHPRLWPRSLTTYVCARGWKR